MPDNLERKLFRRTPVYDHADQWLYDVDREKAQELMKRVDVDVIGTATRIKKLRFRGPDPAQLLTGSERRQSVGLPHRNENYFNVRGVWHIDRIPEKYRPHFQAVVLGLTKAA